MTRWNPGHSGQRIFEGREYFLDNFFDNEADADARVKEIRELGWLARKVKEDRKSNNLWLVYYKVKKGE